MRIASVVVRPVAMPKVDPSWRFALAASPVTDGFFVTVRSDGGDEGIGSTTAAGHLGAPAARVLADLRALAAALPGREAAPETLDLMPGSAQAKAGVDVALHDLLARSRGVPLHRLLGPQVREEVVLLRILALKAPEEVAQGARALVGEGYAYLKIKLDGDLGTDVARVRAVRDAVGARVHLTVDANQSYQPDAAIRAAALMAELGVELFEQPVAYDDLAGLARVTRAAVMPIEADESAQTILDVRRLVEARAVDSISLKIPKLGGIARAREAAAICAAGGVRCRLGAAVGSRILAAAALHIAAATPAISEPCELAEFARLRGDVATGLEPERGRLRVPRGIGLGVAIVAPAAA